ncbi:MAG: hypothetical protein JRF33_24890 [Deltaproteobacteria bacterium]|nr:hypothetical protein [Deltaproteobacteria bacterium]
MRRVILIMMLSLLWAACAGSSTDDGCKKDGDCPINWRCDVYSSSCRCVSDAACNADLGEKCMPDGQCRIYTGCTSDVECGSLYRCDTGTGECLCIDDAACAEGEKCNDSGFCQPATGCFDNEDCGQGEYCDTGTRACIPSGTCNTKFQCAIGQVCLNGTCSPGCEDHGDCALFSACISGTCQDGVCGDNSFCGFMEYCQGGQCLSAYNNQYAPYCRACDSADPGSCGEMSNPCLIYPLIGDPFDDAYPDNWRTEASDPSNYCAVDCSGGQACPNGFNCSSIISITMDDLCTTDADCPGGLPCLKDEEEDTGFCPCSLDSRNPCEFDNTCFQDSCSSWTGTCLAAALSGITISCGSDADCQFCSATLAPCDAAHPCTVIECVLYDGVDYGGCVTAEACGLSEGYRCQP